MKYAVIDIETTGLSRYKHKPTFIGVALFKTTKQYRPNEFYVFDCNKTEHVQKFIDLCYKMRKHKISCIWQNGKFDTLFLEHHYKVKLPITEDVMLMGTAYDLVAPHGLKPMAQEYLGVPDWDIKTKEKTSSDYDTVKPYLTKDLKYTWELYLYFRNELDDNQKRIYKKLLLPAYRVYRRAERRGLPFDISRFEDVRKDYHEREMVKLTALKAQYSINWNSAIQKSRALFGEQPKGAGLPVLKITPKGQPSSDQKVLKRLAADGYELAQQVIDWKKLATVNSMFLKRWGDDAAYDGRIHPNFGITDVQTGRTNCKDPNLQQVPRQSDIRSLFDTKPGRTFFEADYSQLELRIAAHYAQEPTMKRIYKEGGDIHTETARLLVHGREPSKDERSKAKAVNFGFLYGMMAKKFVEYAFDSYNEVFSQQEANQYRDAFFAKYRRLLDWHEEMSNICEMQGGVYNLFGRFRKLPEVYSDDFWQKQSAIRKAINTPVQGSGSDILLSAAIELDRELSSEGLEIYGTIHDSIVGSVPDDCIDDMGIEIKRIMAHPQLLDVFDVELSVPLEADLGWGAWGSK